MKNTTPVLPESYGVNRLVILPCDSKSVFVFWELSEEAWSGQEQFSLTFSRLPENQPEFEGIFLKQVPLLTRTGSLYLKAPAGATVFVEITAAALTSNTVLVPRPFDSKPEIIFHAYALSP